MLPRRLGRQTRQALRPLRPQGRNRTVRRARRPVHDPAPLQHAQRVFVIVDNGSAHRGQRSIDRLQGTWPNLIVVHTPIHASWLNQAEIYFSIVQRKVVTPNTFPDLDPLEHQLLAFGRRYEQIAAPFQWKFTRTDLDKLLAKTETPQAESLAA